MNLSSTKKGKEGEELACNLLYEKGFQIVQRNYHYHNRGEIDIIALDGSTLVFIEVKYRQNLEYGYPEESVNRSKIKQIRKLAAAYLYENNIQDIDCRFDVIAILHEQGEEPVLEYYKDAF